MTVSLTKSAFVDQTSTTIDMSSIFADTAVAGNPAYLVLTALDRDEDASGASGSTGSFTGNGHTLDFSGIGGDGRGAGIVFAYQATTGRYYNSTYGYLDQLTYTSSSGLDDVTSLSLFGTNSLSLADSYADNAYDMMQVDAAGYIGSATIVTEPGYIGTVPTQATPDSVTAAADSFVGKAWNMDGCWVLASTIAAEAGASLPVQSTAIGVPGQASGEWIVAFNGPAGQSGNWESMITAGEIIVIGTAGGGGHITTCVSGSGSSAELVDNITYVNASGQILNSANDGSSSDVIISAAHAASQEWSGVQATSVVIYELDTPIVSDRVTSDTLACSASQSLTALFTAVDPASKAITEWQIYDSASTDSFLAGSTASADHSAAAALTVSSLSLVSLLAGSAATSDVLDARAFNGAYWGDWETLTVTVSGSVTTPSPAPAHVPAPAPAPAPTVSPPVVAAQTAKQTWLAGHAIALALPSGTFHDPQNEALSYTATLASGQALPSWLTFSKATETFTGTAPLTAQTLTVKVTATDTSGLAATETFTATVTPPPVARPAITVTDQTPAQVWDDQQTPDIVLPSNTFTDSLGLPMRFAAYQISGPDVTSWLRFNAATDTLSGSVPEAQTGTAGIAVIATDAANLSAEDMFTVTFAAASSRVTSAVHAVPAVLPDPAATPASALIALDS